MLWRWAVMRKMLKSMTIEAPDIIHGLCAMYISYSTCIESSIGLSFYRHSWAKLAGFFSKEVNNK
jgi:hypothetical protein